jgi:hypothetical protein
MKLVVTGTGRSGTGWCATVLNSAGIFTGHENVFTPKAAAGGLIDWCEYVADASWLAVPRLPLMNVDSCLVVRHPLEVVASMSHIGFGVEPHVNQFTAVAERAGMTPDLDGYLRFWVSWNQQAMRHTYTVFRFEQLLDDPERLTHWAKARYAPREVPGVVNDRDEWKTGDRPVVGWDDFEDQDMVDTAQRLWESVA